jgi:hypothetical protein
LRNHALAAATGVFTLLRELASGVGSLITRPFAGFLQDFPLYLEKIRDRVSFLRGPLQDVSQASKQVEQMMGPSQSSALLVALKHQSLLQILFS